MNDESSQSPQSNFDFISEEGDDDFSLEEQEHEQEEQEEGNIPGLENDSNEINDNSINDNLIMNHDLARNGNVENYSFVSFTLLQLKEMQDNDINQVSNILGLGPEISSILLRYFKWDKEKFIEKYMENQQKVCELAGVGIKDIELGEIQPKLKPVPKNFNCAICCDDPENFTGVFHLNSCNHVFCKECYSRYLTIKIDQDGESRYITCPGEMCKLIVDEKTIAFLVSSKTNEKYQSLLLKTYVDDKPFLKWCPYPGCENLVECKVTSARLDEIVPTVACGLKHVFCFGCGLDNHQPATCSIAKLWLKKCADDSETANWIAANTKECPKCNSTIEKNGGCNHMFCWMCHGTWAEHGTAWYTCNRYEEKGSISARDAQAKSRAALERYLHYYNRYANHEQSAKLDKELFEKTERKMEAMQQTSEFSWIQVQFLKSAVHVLLESRQTLMWTYCLAFFLARTSNATALFEDNQRDLEMAVEALSELLETDIDSTNAADTRKLVLDKTEYVKRRRRVLLSDTAVGHLEHRWVYNLENY